MGGFVQLVEVSMSLDVESLTTIFYVYKKVSKEEARELLVTAMERFREMIHASEKLRPYLRYYPLDIDSVSISLYFKIMMAACLWMGVLRKQQTAGEAISPTMLQM